jgi:hypothetical protein
MEIDSAVSEECSMQGERKFASYRVFVSNLKERDYSFYLDVDGKIILKRFLTKLFLEHVD